MHNLLTIFSGVTGEELLGYNADNYINWIWGFTLLIDLIVVSGIVYSDKKKVSKSRKKRKTLSGQPALSFIIFVSLIIPISFMISILLGILLLKP